MSKFKVVVLDCPYDTWDDPLTKELFHKLVRLKISGYKREYPYGVLPVDTTDFIGTHHMICLEEKNSLEPVMAYRSIALDRSKIHRMSLPVVSLMKLLGATKHEMAIRDIVSRCETEHKNVTYSSSLTVRPDLAGNPDLKRILKTIHVLYHKDYGVSELISGGVLRFKMDQLYYFFGYSDLSFQKEKLPPLPIPFVFDEITGFFHLQKFSDEAMTYAETNRPLWDERLTICRPFDQEQKKAA